MKLTSTCQARPVLWRQDPRVQQGRRPLPTTALNLTSFLCSQCNPLGWWDSFGGAGICWAHGGEHLVLRVCLDEAARFQRQRSLLQTSLLFPSFCESWKPKTTPASCQLTCAPSQGLRGPGSACLPGCRWDSAVDSLRPAKHSTPPAAT